MFLIIFFWFTYVNSTGILHIEMQSTRSKKFSRYLFHELRNPFNVVCMFLEVLRCEFISSINAYPDDVTNTFIAAELACKEIKIILNDAMEYVDANRIRYISNIFFFFTYEICSFKIIFFWFTYEIWHFATTGVRQLRHSNPHVHWILCLQILSLMNILRELISLWSGIVLSPTCNTIKLTPKFLM